MANTLRFKRGLVSGIPTAALGEPLFTTDTFDLYIGNGTGNTRFQKYIASGTTSQLLRGDGSLLTMPIVLTSPSTGQVLKYNGTSWVNDSDAGITGSGTTNYLPKFTGATTLGNSLVFDNGTNVGIGTASPAYKLDVSGEVRANNLFRTTDGTNIGLFGSSVFAASVIGVGSSNNVPLVFGTNATERARITAGGNFIINNSSSDNGLRFQVTGDGYFSGSVGIGTSSLISPLTISKVLSSNQTYATLNNSTNTKYDWGIDWSVLGTVPVAAIRAIYPSTNNVSLGFYTYNLAGDVSEKMRIDTSGNLGLGVVPSTWGTSYKVMQFPAGFVGGDGTLVIQMGQNHRWSGSANLRINTGFASDYYQYNGAHVWQTAASSTAGSTITWNTAMVLDASGRLSIGSGSVTSELLQVNGTMKVTGASTMAAVTSTDIRFATQGFITYDTNNTGTNGLTIRNGAAAASLTIAATGEATFSSSVTAASGFIAGSGIAGRNALTQSDFRIAAPNDMNILNAIAANASMTIKSDFYGGGSATPLILQSASNSNQLYLSTTGNVLIGTSTDTTEKLQVNGAMRVSGASTFGGNMTLTLNQNGQTISTVRNTTAGTTSEAYFQATSDTSSGSATFGKTSSLFSGYKILTASSGYIYNGTAGNLAILNDVASGSIVMAAGASSTAHLTIASTGAATFSSSVTANDVLTASSTGGGTSAIFRNLGAQNSNGIELRGGTAGTAVNWKIEKDNTVGNAFQITPSTTNGGTTYTTPSLTILNTGAATFSSSIKVETAIAIGTTPDTNKPFKILKNINGTVGINFENTSTGSLAFSAIQMGTDVTGGTKFTNLVYSSSGVTASGVYQPDGTSLINNGAGGLNFLGNPIRMYTGGSNGSLRWDMTNDGFITQYTGTNPSTNATDGYRQYSADVVAGNAAPHFRTENGAVIKLYQETTGVGNSIISLGGGNAVLDDTTFDGYTLRQIVKALRNQGILA